MRCARSGSIDAAVAKSSSGAPAMTGTWLELVFGVAQQHEYNTREGLLN